MTNDFGSFLINLFRQKGFAAVAALAVVLGVNAAVAAAAPDGSNVLITQVLYDPVNSESGGEAVELYNPGTNSVNLSGWVLATETSPADATLPQNAVICGGCYYLTADVNWSGAKDNGSWPNADYEEAITLANADAGVAVKDSNGTMVDAVGWGNPANIGSGLFEGTPHPGSGAGNALARKAANGSYLDSNNNSNDFADSAPGFRNGSSVTAESHSVGEIGVVIVVSGSGPVISPLTILTDDDPFLTGSQVSPVPNGNKPVKLKAVVSDSNGIADITSVVAAFNGTNFSMAKESDVNSTAGVYSAALNLSSAFPPGNYTVVATASDASGFSASASAGFQYMSMAAVEVDASSLVFNAAPGLTYEISGDYSSSTAANVTVLNSGNVLLDFDISSTNFTSANGAIAASRLQYAFDGNFGSAALSGNMTNLKQRKDVNLNPNARAGLSLRLNVPLATSPGNYSGTIKLVAVNS
ncbi:lamin tail domain-containing protein [Candidatus Woesearchaeota archaeon]|nr:lamin tail domain-containing protein [Candidatus Woesearchaeota archaeon]